MACLFSVCSLLQMAVVLGKQEATELVGKATRSFDSPMHSICLRHHIVRTTRSVAIHLNNSTTHLRSLCCMLLLALHHESALCTVLTCALCFFAVKIWRRIIFEIKRAASASTAATSTAEHWGPTTCSCRPESTRRRCDPRADCFVYTVLSYYRAAVLWCPSLLFVGYSATSAFLCIVFLCCIVIVLLACASCFCLVKAIRLMLEQCSCSGPASSRDRCIPLFIYLTAWPMGDCLPPVSLYARVMRWPCVASASVQFATWSFPIWHSVQ